MNLKELIKVAFDIQRYPFECGYDPNANNVSDFWLGDRRTEGANPFYRQTESGLFLELYYGGPGSIWTPLGKWGCWGSSSSRGGVKSPMKEFLGNGKMVLEMYKEEETSYFGVIGPFYKIISFDGITLPPAVEPRKEKFSFEDSRRLWETIVQELEAK